MWITVSIYCFIYHHGNGSLAVRAIEGKRRAKQTLYREKKKKRKVGTGHLVLEASESRQDKEQWGPLFAILSMKSSARQPKQSLSSPTQQLVAKTICIKLTRSGQTLHYSSAHPEGQGYLNISHYPTSSRQRSLTETLLLIYNHETS